MFRFQNRVELVYAVIVIFQQESAVVCNPFLVPLDFDGRRKRGWSLVVAKKKVPDGWQKTTAIPFWKKKDSPVDCSNYRPIRLLSHSMNILKRIFGGRIRAYQQSVRLRIWPWHL